MRRVPILIAAVLALCLLVAVFSADLDWTNEHVQQAAVAGGFLALGWLSTFLFREVSTEIARRQKSVDVQEAFRAEIFDYSEALDDMDREEQAEALKDKVLAAGNGTKRYHPLIPRVSPPVVFEALASSISLLPEATIDRVVQFYSMLSDLTVFAEDLMSDAFVAASAGSRSAALYDYYDMRNTTHRLAIEAIEVLNQEKALRQERRTWIARMAGTGMHDV